jgi:hypothetical protein
MQYRTTRKQEAGEVAHLGVIECPHLGKSANTRLGNERDHRDIA